ncbi:ABC transporter substrate-binding protein [Microbacterium xanthum]|uniref:ABC transporter substrate-binding protein n=1 Tax=Microbacterium xanthum TaxID=3079794 RepID=UPI002AD3F0DA|nr:ABC transporter substrate-binding protein [Microbacterium sp. KSW-48]MDZ8171160.1 ABC transporter substrate-binding protein [Microbacterium sp. KSW-48]
MKFPSRKAFTAGVALTAVLAVTSCAAGSTDDGEDATGRGDTLTVATVLEVESFDPAQAKGAHHRQFYQPVYDTLIRQEPDLRLVPMLATDWEYNDDATELTLTIRDDVEFTDGTALDAEAVKLNLERLKDGNGPSASLFSLVSGVSAPDETTVVISLDAPDPSLLDNLAVQTSFIASPTAIEAGNIDTQPVGSGPYVMDVAASVPGSQYTFAANEDYWDPSIQHYDEVILRVIPDRTATLNGLLTGQLNAGLITPKTRDEAVAGGLDEHLNEVNFSGITLLDRDGTVLEPLGDKDVRQAINYAIDRSEILAQIEQGLGTATSQIFPEGSPAFIEENEDLYPYDPEKAKELLAGAGYADGFDMEIPAVNVDPAFQAAISQNLGDVGINVVWNERPASEGVSVATSGDFVAAVKPNGLGNTWWMAQQMLAPDASNNPFGTSDPRIDAALETIQFGSAEESAQAQRDLSAVVTEDAWFVPFYRSALVFVTDEETEVDVQTYQAVPSIYSYRPAG